MNSFHLRATLDVTAAIKGRGYYQWGTLKSPLTIGSKGDTFLKGEKIGVRLSSDKKVYRLVSDRLGVTQVFTMPMTPQSKALLLKVAVWTKERPTPNKEWGHGREFKEPLVTIKGEIDFDSLAKVLIGASLPRVLKVLPKYELESNPDEELCWLDATIQTAVEDALETQVCRPVYDWYQHSEHDKTGPTRFMFLCKSIFSFSGGPYELFRGTSLKEKLDAGYVFTLQTAKTRKIQSWSRDKTIAHDFIGGGFSYSRHDLYVIRGRIPAKLIIATDTMWESLGEFADSSLGKKYFSRVADGLLAQLPERFQEVNLPAYYKAKGNQSLRKAIAIAVSKSLAQICSLGLLHGHEREAVIDFTSGFKPSCEVVYRERG